MCFLQKQVKYYSRNVLISFNLTVGRQHGATETWILVRILPIYFEAHKAKLR